MNPSNELISLGNAFTSVGCLHRDHLRQTLDRIGFKYITGPRHGRGSLCFVLEDQLPALEEALRKAGLPFTPKVQEPRATEEAYSRSIHGRLARIEAKLDRLLELWEK